VRRGFYLDYSTGEGMGKDQNVRMFLCVTLATLCVAMVPPMDMCERCVRQFVDRGGCKDMKDAMYAGDQDFHPPQSLFDHSCEHFVLWGWGGNDDGRDIHCFHRVLDACGFPNHPDDFDDDGNDGSSCEDHTGSITLLHPDNGNPEEVDCNSAVDEGHLYCPDPDFAHHCPESCGHCAVGCTDSTANNYDPAATHDDPSMCTYGDPGNAGPGVCASKACGEECHNPNDVTMVMKYCQPDGTCGAGAESSC